MDRKATEIVYAGGKDTEGVLEDGPDTADMEGEADYLELRSSRLGGHRTGKSGNSNAQDEYGKATGAYEVRLDMMEMAGEVGVKWTGGLLNVYMQEGRIPKEWGWA